MSARARPTEESAPQVLTANPAHSVGSLFGAGLLWHEGKMVCVCGNNSGAVNIFSPGVRGNSRAAALMITGEQGCQLGGRKLGMNKHDLGIVDLSFGNKNAYLYIQ